MELSRNNNTVANERCLVAMSLPFPDQLVVAAHDGKLASEKDSRLPGPRRILSSDGQHPTATQTKSKIKTPV